MGHPLHPGRPRQLLIALTLTGLLAGALPAGADVIRLLTEPTSGPAEILVEGPAVEPTKTPTQPPNQWTTLPDPPAEALTAPDEDTPEGGVGARETGSDNPASREPVADPEVVAEDTPQMATGKPSPVGLNSGDIGAPIDTGGVSEPRGAGFGIAANGGGAGGVFNEPSSVFKPFEDDPLGIVAYYNQRHLPPKWKVYSCDAGKGGHDPAQAIASWEGRVNPWFQWMSQGRYVPVFEVGGEITAANREECATKAITKLTSQERRDGVSVITLTWYGLTRGYAAAKGMATSGEGATKTAKLHGTQGTYVRLEGARMDVEAVSWVLIHEIGHVLGWHHMPYAHQKGEYSYPSDIMSNGDHLVPTHAYNRYRVGWLDPEDVVFHTGSNQTIQLSVPGRPGPQLIIIGEPGIPGKHYAIGANPGGEFGAYAGLQSPAGIDVIAVDQTLTSPHASTYKSHCPQFDPAHSQGMCARLGTHTAALAPKSIKEKEPYSLKPGQSTVVGGVTVTVTRKTANGYELRLSGTPSKMWGRGYEHPLLVGQFKDVPKQHLFHTEINKLYELGVTRGCNPPANDQYCPDQVVTRGQMAAFLTRALALPAGTKVFKDTEGHLFQADIAALEAAGVTRGCNPPANDQYCPDQVVTRGQMAAFLVRALKLPAGTKTFKDTQGHLFRSEIAALEAAGITRGCNPPANDRFCPDEPVTRGQMAAFLVRALGK